MYLALYRKYRPRTFDDVISQEHVTTTLKNQIKTGKIAHAYLFTGSRGTGKTTCAKLLALAVNCLSPKDGNPCGECEACIAAANGCSDIVEMDAASNNGVDDVRALRDEVVYTPVMLKHRVYIIDEAHMMTAEAFNALLKTIEEPPQHVVFILATTELHKIPATILSRCQQFSFNRVSVKDSSHRLLKIAKSENISLDENAAALISRLSDGGMRDAISLLDRCAGITLNITEQTVRDAVGIAGTEHLFSLAECVRDHDPAKALKLLDKLHEGSKDPVLLLQELSGHFRDLMMLSAMNGDFSLIPPSGGDREKLLSQANDFTLGETIRCIEILQEHIASAARMPRREIAAQMCLIRLCSPQLDSDVTALSLRVEKLEKKLADLSAGNLPIKNIEKPTVEKAAEHAILPEEEAPKTVKEVESTPQQSDEKPAWLFENGQPDEYDEYPPMPGDIPAAQQNAPTEPELLFEPDAPAEPELPFEPDAPTEPELPFEPDIPTEPDTPDEPKEHIDPIRQLNDLDPAGQWEQTVAQLPEFLKALLKDVKVKIDGNKIVLSGYSPFLYDFMQKGDSAMRVQAAAKQVTGREMRLQFVEQEAEQEEEIRDRADVFLRQAQSMGVKIKNKGTKGKA